MGPCPQTILFVRSEELWSLSTPCQTMTLAVLFLGSVGAWSVSPPPQSKTFALLFLRSRGVWSVSPPSPFQDEGGQVARFPIHNHSPSLPERWKSVANVTPNPFPGSRWEGGHAPRSFSLEMCRTVAIGNSMLCHGLLAGLPEKWRSGVSATTIPLHDLSPSLPEKRRSLANVTPINFQEGNEAMPPDLPFLKK